MEAEAAEEAAAAAVSPAGLTCRGDLSGAAHAVGDPLTCSEADEVPSGGFRVDWMDLLAQNVLFVAPTLVTSPGPPSSSHVSEPELRRTLSRV